MFGIYQSKILFFQCFLKQIVHIYIVELFRMHHCDNNS